MRESANNPGNGNMAGMGVGMGAAAMMSQMFTQSMQQPAHVQQSTAPAQGGGFCSNCGNALTPAAKFCSNCGASQGAPKCPGCGNDVTPGAKFCANCGQKL